MPVIPLLTDDVESLTEIAKHAKAAGAGYLGARPLFLMPSARKVFLPFIEEKFPRLLASYQKLFRSSAYLPEAYGLKIRNQMDSIRSRYKLAARPPEEFIPPPPAVPQQTAFPFGSEAQA